MKKIWNWLKRFFTSDEIQYPIEPVITPPNSETSPEVDSSLPFFELKKETQIIGIDVYHHDKITSFHELKKTQDFVIFKVSEGRSHEDTKYKTWIKEAREAGLIVGYYHFFRTNVDPIIQAKSFLSKVKPLLQKGDLCIVCDYETEDDKADGFDILEVEQFLLYIEKELNWTPWIYSGHTLKQSGASYKVPERMKRYPLWLAHYSNTRTRPVVPAPWENETLWQWTETAMIKGMNNPKGTDANRFFGDAKTFNNLRYKG